MAAYSKLRNKKARVCRCLLKIAAVSLFLTGQQAEGNIFFHNAGMAENCVRKGDFNGAIACYSRFQEEHDHYEAVACLQTARIYMIHLREYMEAVKYYQRALSVQGEDNLTSLSKKAASRWLERIRLHFLGEALKRYYASEVEYPENLKKLCDNGYIGEDYLVDSRGEKYVYYTGPSNLFKNFKSQKYTLYCSTLGEEAKPLSCHIDRKRTYEDRFLLEGLVGSGEEKAAIVCCKPVSSTGKPETRMVREDEKIGNARVLEVKDNGVILCWEDGIIVLPVR